MARYTSAYSAFVNRLQEVDILLKAARNLERKNAVENASEINALCRGATVLLSSHIEGYMKELGELTLSMIYERGICRSKVSNVVSYHASRDLIEEIKNTSDIDKISEKVVSIFERDSSIWEQFGPYPTPISEERFNKSFSSPSFQKISSYIRRFGYLEFKKDLKSRLKGDYLISSNLIDHIVDVRNKIAHGDSTMSKTPTDLLESLPIVKLFCRTTDDLFSKWCSKHICKIK
ncbi:MULTISPECIES: MAE_28990/MAE_18760 family HEPN-like nuclease [Marinovum]|uniref:MAE_28990/MAE_18760 family HEPN-like nuclease n=1 Tax=Marinovum TaxID=367771 RepID=UPI00237A872D|nr:MAE_28990/MAE_18760 family HEPN-like nuclease [Marinovum sp. PR37]MDD9744054.1 MAE_28990/MAE_18760 family HEPN-like nuclease [Marinovum sp. PR37]